jgi:Zn-dependent protease
MPQSPVNLLLIGFTLAMMVLSISLHDLAQAWMANRLGDPTARMLGRMTMNPVAHFDLWGMGISPLLTLFVFHDRLPLAWGKPVPMTYRNFRSGNGEMLAVLAGPTAQLLAAAVALVILVVMKHVSPGAAESLGDAQAMGLMGASESMPALPPIFPVMVMLYLAITMNLLLLCLNVLPFPFFDGGRILLHFLPYNAAKMYERAGMMLMIAFFLLAWPLTMAVFGPLLGVFNGLLMSH